MKTNIVEIRACKKSILITCLTIFLVASCSVKRDFLLSSVSPAARGYVKVHTDKNKNYEINVRIFNLAEPERLDPPGNIYVVWMDTEDNETRNIGQIKSTKKSFSKALKATLETKSPYKPYKVYVTAEENGNVQEPDNRIILTTERF
jgi:hypothetical protein